MTKRKRTSGTVRAVRGGRTSSEEIEPHYINEAWGDAVRQSGSQQRQHFEDWMLGTCRGLRSWHARREAHKNLGDPCRSPETGKGGTTKRRPNDGDKLRGYWNYYGVRGNSESMAQLYHQCLRLLFEWLNRRSQKRSYTWDGFKAMLRMFAIPPPRIVELPYPQLRRQLLLVQRWPRLVSLAIPPDEKRTTNWR